jgi:hypothetical protein
MHEQLKRRSTPLGGDCARPKQLGFSDRMIGR